MILLEHSYGSFYPFPTIPIIHSSEQSALIILNLASLGNTILITTMKSSTARVQRHKRKVGKLFKNSIIQLYQHLPCDLVKTNDAQTLVIKQKLLCIFFCFQRNQLMPHWPQYI